VQAFLNLTCDVDESSTTRDVEPQFFSVTLHNVIPSDVSVYTSLPVWSQMFTLEFFEIKVTSKQADRELEPKLQLPYFGPDYCQKVTNNGVTLSNKGFIFLKVERKIRCFAFSVTL
jgi:hypothetical protein